MTFIHKASHPWHVHLLMDMPGIESFVNEGDSHQIVCSRLKLLLLITLWISIYL